jgi:hypothetical protein
MVTLPSRDQHGNIVMAGRVVDEDVSKFCYDDCLTAWFMLQDITLRENGAVPGFVFVLDMKGSTLGHITKISLSSMKKYYMYIQVWSSKHLSHNTVMVLVSVTVCTHSKAHVHAALYYQRQKYNKLFDSNWIFFLDSCTSWNVRSYSW